MKRLEGEVLEAITNLGGQPDRYSDFPEDAGRDLVGQRLWLEPEDASLLILISSMVLS